ncbi:DUF167 domain-containing protein [Sphingomonas sp. PAMC 26605]|uniref:DUF167 domain-containing protein n=1 Tax=Sphingomonas sp. PAMC 26605 TaxID=1112214 RepID=UPI00026CD157|nr:DUF167 domain-containing protein [Sphingomonas sp. PAMC 26605]
MSRVRNLLPDRAAVLALVDARGQLAVRATPNASANAVVLPADGAPRVLAVRTTVTPEDGKANDAILTLLAEALGCPKSALTLVRGATARDKLVQIAR